MKKKTKVDVWLESETKHTRKALENASSYFNKKDVLTVNTLEAIYGQESSFGVQKRDRGMKGAAGDFHLTRDTAERYGLIVSKKNDQRFDIDYASIAAARYLKDLDRSFSKKTILGDAVTFPVKDAVERKRFILAAYNGGEGTVAKAQYLAQQAEKDPTSWDDIREFLALTGVDVDQEQIRNYVTDVSKNEIELSDKSSADKKAKDKKIGKSRTRCAEGHWITKDDHHIFICD